MNGEQMSKARETGGGGPHKRGRVPSDTARARTEPPPPQSPDCAILGSSLLGSRNPHSRHSAGCPLLKPQLERNELGEFSDSLSNLLVVSILSVWLFFFLKRLTASVFLNALALLLFHTLTYPYHLFLLFPTWNSLMVSTSDLSSLTICCLFPETELHER